MCITDGPFAETKEQLGGFILIDAKDFNDAIEVASKIPPARLGCIVKCDLIKRTQSPITELESTSVTSMHHFCAHLVEFAPTSW